MVLSDDRTISFWGLEMSEDGEGGALFAWGSGRSNYFIEHSFVQRISAEGELLWADSGIRLDDWNY